MPWENPASSSVLTALNSQWTAMHRARSGATAPFRTGRLDRTFYCDRTALEVFASKGLWYFPRPTQPKAEEWSLSVWAPEGTVRFQNLEVHELQSAWKTR